MRLGYFSANAASGIRPDVLAVELEGRGFDSMWLAEHSHIPVERMPVPPFGADLPDAYPHIMDPFVSLATAATGTSTLLLATGVCMVLEHDVLDLACRAATLDVLSGGRFVLGVGAGWLREELANHRPDVPFEQRYGALVERVMALRACWEDDEAEFAGRWDRFSRSMVNPKPSRGRVPVGFGCSGPLGTRLAAEHADAWLPIDVGLQLGGGVEVAIARFRQLVEGAGRDASAVPITLFVWGWEPGNPTPQTVARYAELDVERIVVCPPSLGRHERDATLRRLDEFSSLLAGDRSS